MAQWLERLQEDWVRSQLSPFVFFCAKEEMRARQSKIVQRQRSQKSELTVKGNFTLHVLPQVLTSLDRQAHSVAK